LGLDKLLDRYPRQLSGGQRQRVSMGRAIVRDPEFFLFDEPLSNLDAKLRVAMRAEINSSTVVSATKPSCTARSGTKDFGHPATIPSMTSS
ncbi:ATP-binding cassette domain-containing protein, partial [Rhizobium ruizarguesonis]